MSSFTEFVLFWPSLSSFYRFVLFYRVCPFLPSLSSFTEFVFIHRAYPLSSTSSFTKYYVPVVLCRGLHRQILEHKSDFVLRYCRYHKGSTPADTVKVTSTLIHATAVTSIKMNAHFNSFKFDHYGHTKQQADKASWSRDYTTEKIASSMLWLGYVLNVH